jgi:hypothetical protein
LFLLTSLEQTGVSYADEPFQITDVKAEYDQMFPVFLEHLMSIVKNSLPTITWETKGFELDSNQPVIGGKVALQDQSGAITILSCATGGYSKQLTYYLPNDMNSLKGNETYKLKIYGGSSGPKDENGNTLPQDLVYTFTTTPTPPPNAPKHYMFKYQYDRQPYGVDIFHMDRTHMPAYIGGIYHLSALAGNLALSIDGDGMEGDASVTLENSSNHTVMYHKEGPFVLDATIPLPAAGEYDLIVNVLNHSYNLSITGPGLQMDLYNKPQIDFPDLKDYELHNTAFDIGVAGLNAKSLDLFVDEEHIKTILPNNNLIF